MRFEVPVLSILLIGLAVHSGGAIAGDFILKAEQMEALEGGPIVARVTLHYQGKDPKEVRMMSPLSRGISVKAAEDWEPLHIRVYGHAGPIYIVREFQPGSSLSEILFLHHDYCTIPKGKAKVNLTWSVFASGGKEIKCLESPSTSMEMDVPPVSAKRLLTVKRRMETELNQEGVSEEVARKIANEIRGTRHKAFIPVAFRLLQSRNSSICYSVTSFVCECSNSLEEAQAEFVNYLCSTNPGGFAFLLDELRGPKFDPSVTEVGRLMRSESLWIRSLTYALFPKKCDQDSARRLLTQLADKDEPATSARIAQLLGELDDDSFDTRERATAELQRMGESAEALLRRSLRGKLSLEVRRRVELVLDELIQKSTDPDCVRSMAILEQLGSAEAREVLEALAQASPDTWRTKEAKVALERMAKRAAAGPR